MQVFQQYRKKYLTTLGTYPFSRLFRRRIRLQHILERDVLPKWIELIIFSDERSLCCPVKTGPSVGVIFLEVTLRRIHSASWVGYPIYVWSPTDISRKADPKLLLWHLLPQHAVHMAFWMAVRDISILISSGVIHILHKHTVPFF